MASDLVDASGDTMNAIAQFSDFHFLRPLWLLGIAPAVALALLLWRRKTSAANWQAAIAPELIGHLLDTVKQVRSRWPWLLLAGWLIALFALAGPTWEKLPQPVLQKRDGLVIVLDLSLSMYAEDIKPSRLERARFKVIDILKQRREGLTGLVVYSGDAHVVSPLTDDTATIENLVPALAPSIMPSFGSNAVAGIDTALQLLRNSGFERGRILLLSDEIAANDIDALADRLDKHWQLSIIGVGTDQGAPIPLPAEADQAGFIKQDNGIIAVAQLHRDRFLELADKVNGRYDDLRVDDSDIAKVLPRIAPMDENVRTLEREFDQWRERGPQLVLLLLPLTAFAFRRGWLLVFCLLPFSPPTHAWEWRDLWLRADQQAQQDFDAGNTKAAAEKFRDPHWRAAAQYRSGDYNAAAQSLQDSDDADALYNRGNALAHAGKLEDAIEAYDAALKKNPALDDAKANRKQVEKLLKEQQQKNPQNNSDQKNQKKDQSQDQKNDLQQDQSQQSTNNKDKAQSMDNKQAQQNAANSSSSKESNKSQNQQQAAAQADEDKDSTDTERPAATAQLSAEQKLQQQATEQWLRQVPDDPSGLLRRKFLYENQQRGQQMRDDDKPFW